LPAPSKADRRPSWLEVRAGGWWGPRGEGDDDEGEAGGLTSLMLMIDPSQLNSMLVSSFEAAGAVWERERRRAR